MGRKIANAGERRTQGGGRSGLRNRARQGGRSRYCVEGKRRSADSYGVWERGRCTKVEVIAGHVISVELRGHKQDQVPKGDDDG